MQYGLTIFAADHRRRSRGVSRHGGTVHLHHLAFPEENQQGRYGILQQFFQLLNTVEGEGNLLIKNKQSKAKRRDSTYNLAGKPHLKQ